MPKKRTIEELLVKHNLTEQPLCPICGKVVKYSAGEFKKFCSSECKNSESGREIAKAIRAKTFKERYGVETPSQSKEVCKKRNKTIKDRYGVDNPGQIPEAKAKIKETFEKLYNGHPMKTEEVKEKAMATNLERYGVEHAAQSDLMKEKYKNTCLERYEVTNTSKIPTNRISAIATIRIMKFEDFCIDLKVKRHVIPLYDKTIYMQSIDKDVQLKYECLDCGSIFLDDGKNWQDVHCGNRCHSSSSYAEKDVLNFVKQNTSHNVLANHRFYYSGLQYYELDVYVPELKLGIEYNGLYWHSVENKGKNYHRDKYRFFKTQGIELVQIFENEWFDKSDIVKSILLGKLHSPSRVLYARKLGIKELSVIEYKAFCMDNHLQGYAVASAKYGAFLGEELVQVLSFSKSRFNRKIEWECIRSCTKLNTNVVGGFERLFGHFIDCHDPTSVLSYCDNRWFTGGSYLRNGYTLSHDSGVNYYYFKTDSTKLYHRLNFRKDRLHLLLEKFDESLSEGENMSNNGYYRIEDAGNSVYVWQKP